MPDLTPEEIKRLLAWARSKAEQSEYYGRATDARETMYAQVVALAERVRELEAENARLREALEKIAGETAATWVSDTARIALSNLARNL